MKTNFLFLILFLPLFASCLSADKFAKNPKHYYIELTSRKAEKAAFEFGTIDWSSGFMNKEAFGESQSIDSEEGMLFFETLTKDMQKLGVEDKDLLIYMHGFYANMWPYFPHTLRRFNKDLVKNEDCQIEIVLSIIWHGGLGYQKYWNDALKKGAKLSPIFPKLHELSNQTNCDLNLLTHSMGNQVMRGAVEKLDRDTISYFEEWVLAAPDLDPTDFAEADFLEKVSSLAKRVHVYTYPRDKVLWLSSIVTGEKRLGAKVEAQKTFPDNIIVVDVGPLKWRNGFSGHVYFDSSRQVREDIVFIFTGTSLRDFSHRKLIDPQFYELHPQ
jgi:carbon monoxide dehydrogenase subunit G